MRLDLTEEEAKDILMNLDQCASEGYINYGDPAYSVMLRLKEELKEE